MELLRLGTKDQFSYIRNPFHYPINDVDRNCIKPKFVEEPCLKDYYMETPLRVKSIGTSHNLISVKVHH